MSAVTTHDRLLRRDYWMVLFRPVAGTSAADIGARVDDHLTWLLAAEAQGTVLLSGPLLDGPDTAPGSGMAVLRVASADEAAALASQDPFVLAGLRTFDVYRWQVNEGSISITLSLGTATYVWH